MRGVEGLMAIGLRVMARLVSSNSSLAERSERSLSDAGSGLVRDAFQFSLVSRLTLGLVAELGLLGMPQSKIESTSLGALGVGNPGEVFSGVLCAGALASSTSVTRSFRPCWVALRGKRWRWVFRRACFGSFSKVFPLAKAAWTLARNASSSRVSFTADSDGDCVSRSRLPDRGLESFVLLALKNSLRRADLECSCLITVASTWPSLNPRFRDEGLLALLTFLLLLGLPRSEFGVASKGLSASLACFLVFRKE